MKKKGSKFHINMFRNKCPNMFFITETDHISNSQKALEIFDMFHYLAFSKLVWE